MAYYDLRNETYPIREIQKILRDFDYIENGRARNPINGVYGENTREGVKRFQTVFALNPTGIVNYITWQLMQRVYKTMLNDVKPPRKINLLKEYGEYPITDGGRDNVVYAIQHMLESVLGLNYNYDKIPLNGIYDEATKEGTKMFQRANLIDDNGVMNTETFNKLADEYEMANSLRI